MGILFIQYMQAYVYIFPQMCLDVWVFFHENSPISPVISETQNIMLLGCSSDAFQQGALQANILHFD